MSQLGMRRGEVAACDLGLSDRRAMRLCSKPLTWDLAEWHQFGLTRPPGLGKLTAALPKFACLIHINVRYLHIEVSFNISLVESCGANKYRDR